MPDCGTTTDDMDGMECPDCAAPLLWDSTCDRLFSEDDEDLAKLYECVECGEVFTEDEGE